MWWDGFSRSFSGGSEQGWLLLLFLFFQLTAVLLAKISDILLLTGVSKQEFLFSLLIR